VANRKFTCRYAWNPSFAARPVTQAPDGALLLIHLAARHPHELRPLLARMAAGEAIGEVAAEAYEVIEGDGQEAAGNQT
jgi:hypothetical protein